MDRRSQRNTEMEPTPEEIAEEKRRKGREYAKTHYEKHKMEVKRARVERYYAKTGREPKEHSKLVLGYYTSVPIDHDT
jgi:hypothetical protein